MGEFLLASILPWLISLLLLVLIIVVIFYIPKLFKGFWLMSRAVQLMLTMIVVLGFAVRFFAVPNYHRIYYDEDRYLSYAVSFAKFGKAVTVGIAEQDKLISGKPDQVIRVTVPVINGWVLKLFGYREHNLFYAAKVFSSLQIVLIFILTLLLFRSYFAALFAALAMALLPTPVYWSVSTGLDSYFVFFSMLSLISVLVYLKQPNVKSSLFLASSIFVTLCVRFEAFLLLPIFGVCFYIFDEYGGSKLFFKKHIRLILIFLPLVVFRGLLSISVLGQKWCCADALPLEAFDVSYLIRHIIPNVLSFFTKVEFPFVITLFAIVAVMDKKHKEKIVLVLWFLTFFLIYSFYYAGLFFNYQFSGSYGRYFLMLIVPVVILAGLGLEQAVNAVKSGKVSVTVFVISSIIVIGTLIPTALKYKNIIATSPYFHLVEAGPKSQHDFLESKVLPNLPKDSIFVNNLSAVSLLAGFGSVYYGGLIEDGTAIGFIEEKLKAGKEVFFMQVYECNIYPDRCDRVNKYFKFTKYLSYPDGAYQVDRIELLK